MSIGALSFFFITTAVWASPNNSTPSFISYGAPCKTRTLTEPRAPTKLNLDLPHEIAKIITEFTKNTTSNFSNISQQVLSSRPDIIGVLLSAVTRPAILSLNIRNRLKVFPNRTGETEAFWRAFETTSNGWTSPFRGCHFLRDRWFYAYIQKTAEYSIGLFLPLELNQCDNDLAEIFGGPHLCDTDTTVCVPELEYGEKRGGYRCVCREGFFYPGANLSWRGFTGEDIEIGLLDSYRCLPCPIECDICDDGGICQAKKDLFLKTIIMGLQLTCMAITLILAMIVFKQRKCKLSLEPRRTSETSASTNVLCSVDFETHGIPIVGTDLEGIIDGIVETCSKVQTPKDKLLDYTFALCDSVIDTLLEHKTPKEYKAPKQAIASGMWTILETILLGIFLLYSTVVAHYFEPSIIQCLVEPWARELGFIICYGAIILKLYRHLIEFRTRKAHRWVIKDTDLLKYLFIMCIGVFAYMAAYTAISLNFVQENYSLLSKTRIASGVHYESCKQLWWDYVTQIGELSILTFGLHLSYATRNARTQFHERRYLCASISIELTTSSLFYLGKIFVFSELHPNFMMIALFLRTQLTATFTLILIFVPKFWYQQKQVRNLAQEYSCRIPVDAFKDMNAHGPLTSNNSDAEVGEVTLADMNPEDIRAELKRLYIQLEIFKNKTIRLDNPHISKRRGGRKAPHRRFSLQKKGSRERNLYGNKHRLQKKEEETTEAEPSRTPEDSVCSNEGPSAIYADLPSTYISENK